MSSRLIIVFIVISMICVAIALPSTKKAEEDDKDEKRFIAPYRPTIAGGTLTFGVLNKILTAIGDVTPKIAIGIENQSGLRWTATSVYLRSGTSSFRLPPLVPNDTALLYQAKRYYKVLATGVVGVLTYSMSDGNSLAVMFSVPYDHVLYSNWWNARIYSGRVTPDQFMYERLYYDFSPRRGDNTWHAWSLGYRKRCLGFMKSSKNAVLQIMIETA